MVQQNFNDSRGNTFSLTLVEKRPVSNSLYPRIEFNLLFLHKQGGPFHVLNHQGEVRVESEGGRNFYLGSLTFRQNLVQINPGHELGASAYLTLDPYGLLQIEKHRGNQALKLMMSLQFNIMKLDQTLVRYDTTNWGQLRFEIAKSDWVEKFLPAFKFKEVSLIEIPKLDATDYSNAINYMDNAWRSFYRGQYDVVLVNCRKTIEELAEIIKKAGYEKTITQESGDKMTVPDWRKFLNQDDMGKNVEEITENIRKFCNPAAHRGKSINKEDADYALMITHATANIIIKNKEKVTIQP